MSEKNSYRWSVLSVRVTSRLLIWSALVVSASAVAQGRVNVSSVQMRDNDRFIVKYKDGTVSRQNIAAAMQKLNRVAGRHVKNGRSLGLKRLRRMAMGADVIVADRKVDGVEAESLMHEIAADPDVDYVEIDAMAEAAAVPNDPYYGPDWTWGLSEPYGIKAEQAWDIASGAGVVVAVADTGITPHSDLAANVLPGYDMVDGGPDGTDKGMCPSGRSDWHGTHVAGTIAAVANNGEGIAGVAPDAKVVPVRVLGPCGRGFAGSISDGVVWAAGGVAGSAPINGSPADVINLSLVGNGKCPITLQNAIDEAVRRGSVVVAASGNYSADTSTTWPGDCNNVITVAATGWSGTRAGFSNYGPLVDVAAPGDGIFSTVNAGVNVPVAQGSYGWMNGTSMAAPHVSGVVALMQSIASPRKTPAEIKQIIKNTASPFPVAPDQSIGTGIINAYAAVKAVQSANVTLLQSGVTMKATNGLTEQLFALDFPEGVRSCTYTVQGESSFAVIVMGDRMPSRESYETGTFFNAAYPTSGQVNYCSQGGYRRMYFLLSGDGLINGKFNDVKITANFIY